MTSRSASPLLAFVLALAWAGALLADDARMRIDQFELEEVMLPAATGRPARKALRIIVYGEGFRATAQPFVATAGRVPVRYLRIRDDERSFEGILLEEPARGSFVVARLDDQEAVRSRATFDPAKIKRLR
jgi:hypothetical protein